MYLPCASRLSWNFGRPVNACIDEVRPLMHKDLRMGRAQIMVVSKVYAAS